VVDYDSTALKLVSASGNISNGTWKIDGIANDGVILWYGDDAFTADSAIVTLTFQVLDSAKSGATSVGLSFGNWDSVSDVNGSDIDNVSVAAGTVTVQAAAHDHQYTEAITTAATCTTEGVKTKTCTVCGDVVTEAIAKISHETELKGAKAATCAAEGYTGDTVCKNCGQTIKSGEAIAKTAHTWNNGEVTKAATETEKGEKLFTCSACGATKTESIPVLVPTETTAPVETTDPTETTAPAGTTDPTETTAPVETTDPTETTAPVETTDPTETTDPVETTDPTETTAPAGTNAPEATKAPAAVSETTPAAKSTSPKTGDEAPLTLWIAVGLFSLAGLVMIGKKHKG
jgi:hypothetical protein